MNKFFFLFGFILLKGSFNAQTKNQHWLNLNAEYSTLPAIVNKRMGANLAYLYGYKKFCSKLEVGVIPGSNFGTVFRLSSMSGITSDLNQAISVHLLAGITAMQGNREYINDKGFLYALGFSSWCADVGMQVRLLKNERLMAGTDIKFSSYSILPQGTMTMGQYGAYSYEKLMASFNLSINYKLNNPHENQLKSSALPEKP